MERCGRATGPPEREATAILSLGQLARCGEGHGQGASDSEFLRAERALGDRHAALRHRSEAAPLAPEAQGPRQRALWAVVGTLSLATAGLLAGG